MVGKPQLPELSETARTIVLVVLLAAGYYALGLLALEEEIAGVETRLLWAPTGLSLAALLFLGPRVWPGILLGSLLINLALDRPPLPSLLVAMGTTIGVWCAYVLLRRVGFHVEMVRVRDVLALLGLGAALGMAIAATINTTVLLGFGIGAPQRYLPRWFDAWTYFALGVIVVTPVLLVLWRLLPIRKVRPARVVEVVALFTCTFLVTLVATRSDDNLFFLPFPVMIWAALRFQLSMVAPCAVLVSTMTIDAAGKGYGVFAGQDQLANEIMVQAFIASITLTGMVLSAAISQRDAAHTEVERTAVELVGVIHQLDRRLRPGLAPGRRGVAPAAQRPSGEPVPGQRVDGADEP